MLTGIFNKDKPIIFLAVSFFMGLFYCYYAFYEFPGSLTLQDILIKTAILAVYILAMLLLDFIGRKNNISKLNTYKIAFFALVTVMIPQSFLTEQVVVSGFLILLALRRIISLRSGKEMQKKILDASLWISLASCFYFWSFLFFAVLFVGIFIYARSNFKNWMVPLVGMAAVITLSNVYTLLVQDAFYTPLDWVRPAGFDFTFYNDLKFVMPITLLISITLWALAALFLKYKKKSLKNKQTTTLVILSLAAAVAIPVLTPVKQGSELFFFAIPFSILLANYFETSKEKIFKEVLFWALFLTPFVILFMQ
tara:strand:+ start:241164 stop:242090 length:927 start_codon:yes stop_codon:yes gene_type:complete